MLLKLIKQSFLYLVRVKKLRSFVQYELNANNFIAQGKQTGTLGLWLHVSSRPVEANMQPYPKKNDALQ